jgi:stage III sporulation protein AF
VLEYIKQWIINIVSLVLFIVILEMLLPKGKMRKYAGLVTGAVLVIAIVNPLLGLLGEKFDFTAAQTVSGNMLGKAQIKNESGLLKEEQMAQIVEVYRLNIIEQIEYNAREIEGVKDARADIIFNEDYDSPAFGEIKRVYLEITAGSPEESGGKQDGMNLDGRININKVEKVEIGKTGNTAEPERKPVSDDIGLETRKMIEDRISRVFGVDRENIIIS